MPRVGEAYVDVEPDVSGFGASLRRQIRARVLPVTESEGSVLGRRFGLTFRNAAVAGIASQVGKWGTVATLGAVIAGPLIRGVMDLASLIGPTTVAIGALGVAFGTAKVGASGMGESFKAYQKVLAADTTEQRTAALKEYQKTLANLAPSARQTVTALIGMRGAWTGLRLDVQQRLFAGIGQVLQRLGAVYIPILRQGLGLMATSLNGVMKRIADALLNGPLRKDLPGIFRSLAALVDTLGKAFAPLLTILSNVLVTAAPVAQILAQDLVNGIQRTADATSKGRATGGLAKWFRDGYDALQALLGLIGDLARGLAGIGANADFVAFVGSIRTYILPPLLDLVRQLSSPVNANGLIAALGSLLQALVDLNAGGVTAAFVKTLAALIGGLASLANAIPGGTTTLAYLASGFAAFKAVDLVGSALHVRTLASAIGGFARPAATMASGATGAAKAGAVLRTGITNLIPVLRTWGMVLWASTGPIALIVLGIAALVVAIVLLWRNSKTFREIVTGAWNAIKAAAMATVGWLVNVAWPALASVFRAIAGVVLAVIRPIWAVVRVVLTLILAYWLLTFVTMQAVLRVAWAVISAIFNTIRAVITAVVVAIYTVVATYVRLWWLVISTVMRLIWTVITTVWNTIKGTVTAILSGIWSVISGTWNRIKNTISAIVSPIAGIVGRAFSAIAGAIKGAATAAFNAAKGIATTIYNGVKTVLDLVGGIGSDIIRGIVNGITSMGQWLWDQITGFIKRHVPGPIAKILGITSPSKVTFGFGQQVVRGLVLGIQHDAPAAGRAAALLGQTVTDNYSAAIAPLNTALGIGDTTIPAPAPPQVRVFLGDRELTDLVRTEVDGVNVQQARQLTYGRRF